MSELVQRVIAAMHRALKAQDDPYVGEIEIDGLCVIDGRVDLEAVARVVLLEVAQESTEETFERIAGEITSGKALDKIAARYGLRREEGEPDADLRPRVLRALVRKFAD